MKIKKIISILTFFLLFSCGFEPIYSKKKLENKYNFTITSIGFSGKNSINQNLKNNLVNYINIKEKPIKYELVINSSIIKTITSKNKKGNPEIFYTKIVINVDVIEADKLKSKTIFEEGFEYKNKSNKFELNQYEKNIQKQPTGHLCPVINQYQF